jgi:hypothetical protein
MNKTITILLLLLIVACRNRPDKKDNNTAVKTSEQKLIEHTSPAKKGNDQNRAKNPSREKIELDRKTIVIIEYDSVEIAKAKEEQGEQNFLISLDDLMWYNSMMIEKVNSLGIPVKYTDKDTVDFHSKNFDKTIIKDSTFSLYTYFYFDGKDVKRRELFELIENDSLYSGNQPKTLEYTYRDITFTFSRLTDPYDLGLYQRLDVKFDDSTAISIGSKATEFEGQKFELSSKYIYQNDLVTFILIPTNNRPEPNYYYVLRQKGSSLRSLGKTPPITKDYFGDIDDDGFLEIGGYKTHCQTTGSEHENPESCLENFRVYQIEDEIVRDKNTEKILRNQLKKK